MRPLRLYVTLKGSYSGMSSVPDNNGVENETEPAMADTSKHYQRLIGIAEREDYLQRRSLK